MSLEENMEEILNIDVEHVEKPNLPKVKSKEDDQQKDYEYTRGELYSLIDQGQEAVRGALEVAQESGQAWLGVRPRRLSARQVGTCAPATICARPASPSRMPQRSMAVSPSTPRMTAGLATRRAWVRQPAVSCTVSALNRRQTSLARACTV